MSNTTFVTAEELLRKISEHELDRGSEDIILTAIKAMARLDSPAEFAAQRGDQKIASSIKLAVQDICTVLEAFGLPKVTTAYLRR